MGSKTFNFASFFSSSNKVNNGTESTEKGLFSCVSVARLLRQCDGEGGGALEAPSPRAYHKTLGFG